jgi:glycosyltransferase involved in cell wall biosynthesis
MTDHYKIPTEAEVDFVTGNSSLLIVCPFLPPNIGGVETHLANLLDIMAKRSIQTTVVGYLPLTSRIKARLFERKESVRIFRLPWIGRNLFYRLESFPALTFLYLFPALFAVTLFISITHPKRYSIVHAHGFVAAAVVAWLPFVDRRFLTIHAIYDFTRRGRLGRQLTHLLSRFDKVFSLSQQSVMEMRALARNSVDVERYIHWIDLTHFSVIDRTAARRILGLGDGPIILFVGRLFRPKGVEMVIELGNRLRSQGITTMIVGDGPLNSFVRDSARRNSSIIFHNKVTEGHLPYYYSAADLVLVPSAYEEGFGRVAIEALACGTPVIASRVGGLSDTITFDVGFLVEPNVDSFYDLLMKLLVGRITPIPLREACRSRAEAIFSDRNAEVFVKSYGFS